MDEATKPLIQTLSKLQHPILPDLSEQEQSLTLPAVSAAELSGTPLVASLQIAYPQLTAEQIEAMLQEM